MSFSKNLSFILLLSSLINLTIFNLNAGEFSAGAIKIGTDNIFEDRRDGFIVCSDPMIQIRQLEQYVPNPFVIAKKILTGQLYQLNNNQKRALWLVEQRIKQFKVVRPDISNDQMLAILPDLILLHEVAKQILVNPKFVPNNQIEKNLVKILTMIKIGDAKKSLSIQKFASTELKNMILNENTLDLFDYEIFLWLCGKSSLLNKYNIFKLGVSYDQFKKTPKIVVIHDQFNCQDCYCQNPQCLWRKNNKLNLKPVVLVPVLAPAKIVPAPTPAPAPVPVQDQKKRNDQERIADYRQADQMFNFVNF